MRLRAPARVCQRARASRGHELTRRPPVARPPHRIVISDGVHYQQAMLATQQNSKVLDGSLVSNCIVSLKQYICNTVQGKK